MRHVEDGDVALPQLADDGEEAVDLGAVEGGGGLVHDHDPEVLRECLGHLHQLLVRHAEVLDALLRPDIQAELAEDGGGTAR